ncbi:MAG: hypothetical protein JKY93_02335 [Gammaproteobacteria bacterium]|nr:hypothetical protein [Gammaproteobacteria bacterium]
MVETIVHFTAKYGFLALVAVAALFGASTRTFFEYQRDKCTAWRLIRSLAINSFFSLGLALLCVFVFLRFYPTEETLAVGLAYMTGAIGLNIVFGFYQIEWKSTIESRLPKL